jgi:hypothetical protein
MEIKLTDALKDANNLEEIRDAVVSVFEQIRSEAGEDRTGYVSGIIGIQKINKWNRSGIIPS